MELLQRLVTRTTELLVAIFSLISLAPVLLLIMLAVKISSPGPVFFRQSRKAPDGSNIYITKFRTMRMGEDEGTGKPRVTAIGALLRRTYVDELPALFDVLFHGRSLIWRRGTPRPALFSLGGEVRNRFETSPRFGHMPVVPLGSSAEPKSPARACRES